MVSYFKILTIFSIPNYNHMGIKNATLLFYKVTQGINPAYALVFLLLLAGERSYGQCVSLTTLGSGSHQSFNTLSNTAGSTTNNLTITGWFMTETGGGARDNEQYAVDNGSSTTGDTYSFGTAAATDRALGGLRSGTLIPVFGSCFTNNTGSTIASLDIAYTGEEWRLGTADRTDQLDFQYSLNATSLTTGTWVDVNALDFTTPNTTAPTGAKDGNAAANRTALSATISGLSIPNGATFWIRWTDTDASGADDGLAVDDFSLTPNGAAAPPDYTISTTGNAIVITDVSGNGETLDVSQSGSNINFNVAGRTYSLDGGTTTAFPVNVLLAGANSITINAEAGNDFINMGSFSVNMPSLTINGGTGDDAVNFNGDITFAANAHLDVDMQNDDAIPGVDQVTVMPNANLMLSGTGSATVKVSRYVDINSGSSIETANGNLTVETNQQATPTTGSFFGILISGGALKTSGSGTLTVKGKGGTDAVGGQKGIYVLNSSQISGGSTGAVIVEGTGGPSAGNFNDGLFVDANGIITSLGGNVSVTGLGNGTGSSETNFGVFVRSGGQITAGGTGSVTVHGTGAATAGSNNRGIVVFNTNARITSSGGNVSVTGQGGGTGSSGANWGVYLLIAGEITAGGSGTVTVAGTGGAFSGDSNYGVFIESANARITSSGGAVSVTGQGGGSGASSSNYGIFVQTSNQITAGGSGTVTVQGTGGAASGTNNYGVVVNAANAITSTGGNVSVTGQGAGSAADIITQSGGSITSTSITAGITLNSTNNGTWPNTAGTDVSTLTSQKTTFGPGSKLNIDIDGLTVNTQYQQLEVIGMIDLNGAGLTFAGSTFTPSPGNTFTIVNNDGTDAIIGTFNGLPEGAAIPNFLGSGLSASITYTGGTGNDVVLTVVNNVVCYADVDGDGYGDPNNNMTFAGSCGVGFVSDNTDCNDNDDDINPAAMETCDGCDKNCDGMTGDGPAQFCGLPTPPNCVGIQFCIPQPVPPGTCLPGGAVYGPCNNNPQPETCDGIDNNCDGMVDNGIPPVPCVPPGTPPGLVYGGTSQCQQGTITCGGVCIGFVGPSAEICDGIDNDCDGIVDEDAAVTSWYEDMDNDGFGNPAVSQSACTQPPGYVADNTDCNDNDPALPAVSLTMDTLAIQDFEIMPATPTWSFTGPVVYNSGFSAANALPPNSPIGIGGSRAWETTSNSGGLTLEFDNITIPSGYDNIRVQFRLAAMDLVGADGGPDDLDYVLTRVSLDNGATYYSRLRIRGAINNNSHWPYDATGVASVNYQPQSEVVFQPINSGLATDLGYSTCEILFPGNVSQIKISIIVRSSASTDTWLIDNVLMVGEKQNPDADCDGYASDTDCDDTNAAINPGATESCNGIDDDCDMMTDEGVLTTWYLDADTDGYYTGSPVMACTSPGMGYVTTVTGGGDCNDNIAAINPGAMETCNGIDDDCDGSTDEGVQTTFYEDVDGDGYGDPNSFTMDCTAPIGYVSNDEDCDDTNDEINPGATEICDGIDNDCDTQTDEGLTFTTYYTDTDGDGYGTGVGQSLCANPGPGFATLNGDCNDNDDEINPAATEICDGIDNDCDTQIDEGLTFITYYTDADGDGYGTGVGQSLCADPGAGFATLDGDCDDNDDEINPAATEICDGIDNDCDTQIDEGLTFTTYYTDADGDGYGTGVGQSLCANPGPGFATLGGDCNDNDDEINPAATEICDGIDNDCDTQIDEGLTFITYYTDADGDGYGTGVGQSLCADPGEGFATLNGDCNDNNPAINPAAPEICDGIDNNCNGQADEPKPIGGAWSNSDAGGPGVNGSASVSCNGGSEVINIAASGFSTSSSDKLHLVYQTLCGNGEIIARVLNVQSGGWAGITLRETLMPGSKKVALKTQLSSVIRREIRTVTNGAASILNFNRPQHVWLRLVRSGGNFTGYTSVNGINWDFAFTATISMGGCVYAGLFAESINTNVETNVSFDNVTISGTQNLAGGAPLFTPALDGLSVSVYPNPGNGEMTLSVTGAPKRNNLQLEVIDVMGRIVHNISLPEGAVFTYPLDLSREPAGVYYLRLRSEVGVENVQRVVVQQ